MLLIIFVLTPLQTKAQLSLEHVYPNGSLSITPQFESPNQLFLWEFEVSGWKYVRIDRITRQIDLFHLDHTLWKSISFNMTTMLNPNVITQEILYISEHLFDLDDGIEFLYSNMYVVSGIGSTCVTQVVDEETSGLIFDVQDQYPGVKPNYHQQQYPIKTTSSGTKLILSGLLNDSAYVYALPGDLHIGMAQTGISSVASGDVLLYPNPTNTELTVMIPLMFIGSNLEIFTSNGQLVKQVSISDKMLVVDISGMGSGHYVCRAIASDGTIVASSFVKN